MRNKLVTLLSGKRANAFIAKMENTAGKESQLIMAKATGHFKRGNEK